MRRQRRSLLAVGSARLASASARLVVSVASPAARLRCGQWLLPCGRRMHGCDRVVAARMAAAKRGGRRKSVALWPFAPSAHPGLLWSLPAVSLSTALCSLAKTPTLAGR